MKEFTRFEIWNSQASNLEVVLSSLGLKKKFLRKKFVGEDVEVKYPYIPPSKLGFSYSPSRLYNMVTVKAKDEKKGETIYKALNCVRPVFI